MHVHSLEFDDWQNRVIATAERRREDEKGGMEDYVNSRAGGQSSDWCWEQKGKNVTDLYYTFPSQNRRLSLTPKVSAQLLGANCLHNPGYESLQGHLQ